MKHLIVILILSIGLNLPAQIGENKNYVIWHQSSNQKYELLAIPHSDAGDGEVSVYVYERKGRIFLYEFTEENMTDMLYVLSDDGMWLTEYYANLCAQVRDPKIWLTKRYYQGHVKDTIQMLNIPVNYSYLISYKNFKYGDPEHNKKRHKKRWKTRNSETSVWGDTLRVVNNTPKGEHVYYFQMPVYTQIKKEVGYKTESAPYKKLRYKIRYMNIYQRERLQKKIIKRYNL